MLRTLLVFITIIIMTIFEGIIILLVSLFSPHSHIIDTLIQTWCWAVLKSAGVRVEVSGKENIILDRPGIYISNHLSHFDVPALYRALQIRDLRMIAKKELTKIPIFGWGMITAGFIIIDRDNHEKAIHSLDEAAKKLKNGTSVAIFAEGTRSPDGEVKAFKKGGFILAIKSGLPIIPVSISGSRNILPKKTLMVRPGQIHLVIGSPINTNEYSFDRRNELINRVRNTIIQNLTNYQPSL